MKMKGKFYCGAQDILTSGYLQESQDQAITRARETLKADPRRGYVAIVKIVALVKRADTPITVVKIT